MAYYTVPTNNDTTGIFEYFGYVNTVASGLFFPVITFVIWIIAFIALKQYSTSRAWTFASLFCAILSIMLAVMDYVSPKFMYIFIVFTAIGFVWLKLEAD